MPLALLALVAATPAPAPAQTFRVAAVEFRLPTPAGYCPPTGNAAAVDQVMAAADGENVSLLTLLRCPGTATDNPDYFMLKTPKVALAQTIGRPELLAELAKVMDLPDISTVLDNSVARASAGSQKAFGKDVNLAGKLQPLGRDAVCAYMGGVLSFAGNGTAYKRAVSVCLTAVGGKMIGVTRYSDGADAANVQRHLKTARALAEAIEPVAARP